MSIPKFRDWRIRTKLIIVTLFLVLLPLMCVAYLSMDRFGKALRSASEEDLEHLVRNIYSMCKVQEEMVQMKVVSDLNVAREILYRHGHKIEIVPEKKVSFDAVNQFTNERFPVTLPFWRVGGVPLSRDTHFVDEVQNLVGGTCTIFQRIEGDHLLRISTNVIGKEGKRAVGTFIPSYSPVAEAILAGRSYRGRAYVVDDWYITAYEPIKGRNGTVIGALYVGVREQSARSLRHEIKRIKVGDTGYVFIIDSNGILKVHPAKEGQNVIGSMDSSGFEYIRSMVEGSLSLPEGDVGTIRYPWINPELGEKKPRQKINKYIYFEPWDWIIAAGTYEEEIYHALYETERFIMIMVIVGIALVFILTITFSKVLTRPIQELTEVTTKMVGGDLSQRVRIHGADEIGVLGVSFNRMIVQIQHHTSNLENMVEARTQELKESREEYRELSRFLNSILDSATEYGIMALDFYGKIIEFNKGAEKLFGWTKEEVLNKEKAEITLLPEDRKRGIQKEMAKRLATEGVCELEMDRVRKNGEHFPALSTITAIKDPSGKTTGFVEIVRDITRRKALEKELRETKEFLENIMESSVDGIVTTDLKGKITYLNRAIEEMLGYMKEDLLGEHISRLYVRGIQEARDIMALLQAGERAGNYEMEVRRKEDEILAILTSLFLVRDEDGQVVGTAGIFKDVTEKKRLEAKLKAAQAHLVEASKMRALGELVAGVAHELNNPLMASQTILHVILNNPLKDCPNLERLELVRKCNDRIEKIVEHLREFSRQTKPEFRKLDINRPIENALMITGQQLLSHNISVVKRLSEDLPEVLGDSNQLEQVFLNLISNARDAMDVATCPTKELTICSYINEDEEIPMVAVSIKDSGVGIPEKNLDKVFEPFFSTKPVGKGTGLGLSLCFGIVEAHGGRLEIKSQHFKGTEVKVVLPVVKSGKE
ncbi:MAG: Cache 3/Cache 2 fusion domain-containing protein [Deltaproteobacteria bacterium]|nr:Cache 3/Cache 2 fusion domain-containing protein [Deltaproteobacteria bacterium]MBW2115487.1 Cache 3/Cache 2 fusion domain-containing protein [Deltaproteobacteria bacterium]